MLDDHIDMTVNQLIGLFDKRPVESVAAWYRLRPALLIVLDELSVSAPLHPAAQRIKAFIQSRDYFFFTKRN